MHQTADAADTETRAQALLDAFSAYTGYQHGEKNPHIARIAACDAIDTRRVCAFLSAWWSFSRRTPQILLNCAAAYPEHDDRLLIMQNYIEEDGMLHVGDSPHYDLLVQLIEKLGGSLVVNGRAEALIKRFMGTLGCMSPARATGVVSGFEHPALDITKILLLVVDRGGFAELLETDVYLTIHVQVEPSHIVWAHGNSLAYMERGDQAEVLDGFRDVMTFWLEFWELAMGELLPAGCGWCDSPHCESVPAPAGSTFELGDNYL